MKLLIYLLGIVLLATMVQADITVNESISFQANQSNVTYTPIYEFTVNNITLGNYSVGFDEATLNKTSAVNEEVGIYPVDIKVRSITTQDTITTYNATTGSMNYSASWTNTDATKQLIIFNESFDINITKNSYADFYGSYITTGEENELHLFELSPYITFNIKNEIGGTDFPINETNSIKLSIYCENQTIEYDFNVSGNSSIYQPVTCHYNYMVLSIEYNSTSYFRTLIPEYSSTNTTWFMIDTNENTAYQVILKKNDLTGQFKDATVEITKIINNESETMIKQYFDAESKSILYLIKDGFYTITLRNSQGDVRNLGYLIADEAGTKTINIPDISFIPDDLQVGNKIGWDWRGAPNLIQYYYNDTNSIPTDNITFYVYNGTNSSQLIYSNTQYNVSSASFSYIGASNESYVACFIAYSPYVTGNMSSCQAYTGNISVIESDGVSWTEEEEVYFKGWFFFIIIGLIFFGVGKSSPAAALGLSTFIIFIGWKWGWFLLMNDATTIIIMSIAGFATIGSIFMEVNK